MFYHLRDRVFVGCSVGHFKFKVLETFEDRDLAYKECELIRANNSESWAHIVEIEDIIDLEFQEII